MLPTIIWEDPVPVGNDNDVVEVELINCERVIPKEGGVRNVVVEIEVVLGADVSLGLELEVIVVVDVVQVVLKSGIQEEVDSGSAII